MGIDSVRGKKSLFKMRDSQKKGGTVPSKLLELYIENDIRDILLRVVEDARETNLDEWDYPSEDLVAGAVREIVAAVRENLGSRCNAL